MQPILTAVLCTFAPNVAFGGWPLQTIATEADFRGLAVVDAKVVWVSGTKGTFGRTVDGGTTWTAATVPGAEKLDFRDVEAFGENTAYLMAAGPGEASQIHKTTDGGKTWHLQFRNAEPKGFFNALAFWDETHGLALGDPVDGRFQLLTTDDGTKWTRLPEKSLPVALPNEGCFAASGTCLVTQGKNDAWFCTGGAKATRLFHTTDRGKSWNAVELPLLAGVASAGAFSIAFRDAEHGMVVGGDYRKPEETVGTGAVTSDGGKTWKRFEKPLPFRSAIAWSKNRWIAAGTSGADVSTDDGATWQPQDAGPWNSVAFAPGGEGWAVGPKGRIAKVGK